MSVSHPGSQAVSTPPGDSISIPRFSTHFFPPSFMAWRLNHKRHVRAEALLCLALAGCAGVGANARDSTGDGSGAAADAKILMQDDDSAPEPRRRVPEREGSEDGEKEGPVAPSNAELTRSRAMRAGEAGGPTRAEEAADPRDEFPRARLLADWLGIDESFPVQAYGWVQGNFTANPAVRVDGQNFGYQPNNLANSFFFQQIYFILEKRVEQEDLVDLGFRIDNLFGDSWSNFRNVGFFDSAFQVDHFGWNPPQMYGEIHLPILGGIDIKGGRFYSLAGYEDGMAPARPLLSTGYLFAFSHPFTHFGVMSTWQPTERINIYNGIINGWDRWINEHYQWGYQGGVSWDSRDERTNLTLTANWGPNQISQPSPSTGLPVRSVREFTAGATNLFTLTLIRKMTDRFSLVAEADAGWQNRVYGLEGSRTGENAYWQGVSGWLMYDFRKDLTGVFRGEIFGDPQGFRSGYADNLQDMTLGLIWKPTQWIWFRPETRFDWSQHTSPFAGGTSKHQLTFGFDIIFLF